MANDFVHYNYQHLLHWLHMPYRLLNHCENPLPNLVGRNRRSKPTVHRHKHLHADLLSYSLLSSLTYNYHLYLFSGCRLSEIRQVHNNVQFLDL